MAIKNSFFGGAGKGFGKAFKKLINDTGKTDDGSIFKGLSTKIKQLINLVALARINSRLSSIQELGGDTYEYLEGIPTTPSGRVSRKGLTQQMIDQLDEEVPTRGQWLKRQSELSRQQSLEIEWENEVNEAWEEFIDLYKNQEKRAITFTEGSDIYDTASEIGGKFYHGDFGVEDLENLKNLNKDIKEKYGHLL